jgi:hypothetical protein
VSRWKIARPSPPRGPRGNERLKWGASGARPMGLLELFVAALIAGISAVNVVVAGGAWVRARDPRLLLIVGANTGLVLVGLLWAWGQFPGGPSQFGAPSWPILILVLLISLFLLGTALLPRRT